MIDYDDPNKNYWYSIDYEWNNNNSWTYFDFNESLELTIDNDKGNMQTTSHYHTDAAHKTLGGVLAPDDNNISQAIKMREIASHFGDKIRLGCIKSHDALYAICHQ